MNTQLDSEGGEACIKDLVILLFDTAMVGWLLGVVGFGGLI